MMIQSIAILSFKFRAFTYVVLVMQVFQVHSIKCEVLNGGLSQKECTDAVKRF